MKKRTVCIMLVTMLVWMLALAGCGSEGKTKSPEEAKQADVETVSNIKDALEAIAADTDYYGVTSKVEITLSPKADMKIEGNDADGVKKGLKDLGISTGTRLEYDSWEGTTVTVTLEVYDGGMSFRTYASRMVDGAK